MGSGPKARRASIFVLAVVLLLSAPGARYSQDAPSDFPTDPVTREDLKFTQVYGALEENYVEALDPDQAILNGAVRGMLSSLDPFSAFFDPDQFELLQQQARGEALGFGSILYVQPAKILVLQTAQGSPSWRAGLGPGDEIVEVNGQRIARLDFDSLIRLLQQARSQPVRLGVIHPGKVVPEDFELRPAEVALPTVDKAFLLSAGIAYVHVASFESKTPQEIVNALKRLETEGQTQPSPASSPLQGLILDLRDNHGGMVEAAIGVASLFLPPDQLVLTVRGRAQKEQSYRTSAAPFHFDAPLIVLVNGETASAAEVVVAALEEHDRALIAGEPTYGKGVVETVSALSRKTGLALTTAQYFTPSGRSIQRPLAGTALAQIDSSADPSAQGDGTSRPSGEFHTDDGRALAAGGGITPDVLIPAPQRDAWATFLNQRGVFTQFASDYLAQRGKVEKSFEPDSGILADFRDFLERHQVRVPEEYWTADQAYLKTRIKVEVFNLAYGLASGDEVETRADPQVQAAARLFPKLPSLLKATAAKAGDGLSRVSSD